MELGSLVSTRLVFPALAGNDVGSLLRSLAEAVAASGEVRAADELRRRLEEREALGTTAIGGGVALPHCKLPGLVAVKVAIGIAAAPEGVEFGAPDGKPVRAVFAVLSPEATPAAHLKALAAISRWVRQDGNVASLIARRDPGAIVDLLQRPPAGAGD